MSKNIYILLVLAGSLLLLGASCIQINGSTTGGGAMGIFRSEDGGTTWVQKAALPTAKGVQSIGGAKVYRIFTDPSDANALYMGTRGQGLFYSYDNGDTWTAVSAMAGKYIYALAVDPRDKCTIFVSDGPHVYKTNDCLRTWSLAFTEERPDQRFTSLIVDYQNSSIVYGAEIGGDILRSKDGGSSWRIAKRFNFEIRSLVLDRFTGGRLYAAALTNGLYKSDDGGDNWTDLSSGFSSFSESKNFYRMYPNPAQKDSLFWVSKYGILRSDDAGKTWTDLKLLTAPGSVNIYSLAVNPKNQLEIYYTGTILSDSNANVRSTLYKTTDGGKNWVTKNLPTNTIPVDMLIQPANGKMLFVGFTTP
ncbi:MAG: hypothetical protein WC526_01985 [Patescibacteria group bacterium]